ncbi:MAG: response regulator transcription factor [Treponema sp.]|nr:response regulator transcription factor [Treponema sp.]
MRLLLVEEDVRLSQSLVELFQRGHYGVDAVYTAEDALKYIQSGIYDGIVLDSALAGKDSIAMLKGLREKGFSLPVVVLSDKGDKESTIKGLDYGADDYIVKPFDPDILLARVGAATRRKGEFKRNTITFGDLILDKDNCELRKVKGGAAKLSLKELQIIEFLFDSPHRVIKKETIIEKIWGSDSSAEYNNVEVYISFIRKKMEDLKVKTRIRTARGIGYSLEDKE